MSDDAEKRRTTLWLSESLLEAADEAVDRAPDDVNLSRSEILRYAIERGIECEDEVLDLIPEELLGKYRTQRETNRIQSRHYVIDKREGWRGRVKSYLNARLAGEEPYHPEGIELLAAGYREELRMLDELAPESSRSVEEDLAWLDEQLSAYRDAWQAKGIVPDARPFEGIEDKIETGRDLLSLRTELGGLIEYLSGKARSAEAGDSEAIVTAAAREYGVSERAVEVVLDTVLPEDTDPHEALLDLRELPVDEVLPPEATEQLSESEPPEIGAERGTREIEYDGQITSEQVQLPAGALDQDGAPEIDEDALRELVDQRIENRGDLDD